MNLKAYKPALILLALLAAAKPAFPQDTTVTSEKQEMSVPDSGDHTMHLKGFKHDLKMNMKHLELAMNDLNSNLNIGLKELNTDIHTIVMPEITNMVNDIKVSVNDNALNDMVQKGDISEKVKSYSKSYPMDGNDKLNIDNKFGKVLVNAWNKNEVKVDVEIRSYADNDETAQKMIDAVSISDSKEGNVVSFGTNFGKGSSNSVWDLFNNRNDHHKVEVNYTIYMPTKNGLSISNKYGSIEIPDMSGKVSIDCAYGSFSGGSMTHADNEVRVRYGSAKFENIASGDIQVSYGSLDMGDAGSLNAGLRYSSAKIGRIKNSANIDGHYAGGIKIEGLDKNFSSFSFSSNYSNLTVGIDNSTNANFDITVRYGDFSYGDAPVQITEKTPSDDSKGWRPTKNFKGHIGKGGGGTINISTSYGGVKFD